MTKPLADRVAIITGASSGIGQQAAYRLARDGATVIINYRSEPESARAAVAEVISAGGRARAMKADVSKPSQVRAMVKRTLDTYSRLDILVNNAGIETSAPLLETTDDDWTNVLRVNLDGAFYCLRECARAMKARGGSIINVSSVHEDLAFPTYASYAASKGGLRMLMRTAAVELAPFGIRVNNVAPGAIATPINAATLRSKKKKQQLENAIPMGRIGTPQDVADVVAFLASDDASYVTGSTYLVDGGLSRFAQPL